MPQLQMSPSDNGIAKASITTLDTLPVSEEFDPVYTAEYAHHVALRDREIRSAQKRPRDIRR